MVRLFIDSSSDYLSLLIKDDERTVGFSRISCGRRMSELIISVIDGLLKNSMVKIEEIDEYYVITGPGSFTGVRIGVATALGLGAGAGKPCYGITSLDAAALSSRLEKSTVASRLKGDVFAMRSYDFEKGVFGEFIAKNIDKKDLGGFTLVNTDGAYFIDLEKAVANGFFLRFRGDCKPIYLRKAEAEINVDKKSGIFRP